MNRSGTAKPVAVVSTWVQAWAAASSRRNPSTQGGSLPMESRAKSEPRLTLVPRAGHIGSLTARRGIRGGIRFILLEQTLDAG